MAKSNAVRWIVGLVVLGAFGVAVWLATRPPPLTIQGEVSADRVDISPRVGGRIGKLGANVGDMVERGTTIAELDSPQLVAALVAARAALSVANADLARINSTRPETIAARRADSAAAQADVTLRKKDAADAALQLAVAGASPEERALAAAQVKQADAALSQREVDVAELVIRSPIAGQVTTRIAELGENFSAGAPLFSMVDIRNVWFTFNLREDLLGGLKVGDTFEVTVPALRSERIPVRVTVINVQGQYATWRATRATGEFDLRTFEVRAAPVQPREGLRPGMSAIASWAERGR